MDLTEGASIKVGLMKMEKMYMDIIEVMALLVLVLITGKVVLGDNGLMPIEEEFMR
ncbi:hypothetical protein D3C72_1285170 [compost metagenome]